MTAWAPHPTNHDALRAAGVTVDPDGTAILWHATHAAGADGIEGTGLMTSSDGEVWFSTSNEIAQMHHGQGRPIDTFMQIRVRVVDLHQQIGFDQGEPGAEITHFTAVYNEKDGYRPVCVETRQAWSPASYPIPEDWDI